MAKAARRTPRFDFVQPSAAGGGRAAFELADDALSFEADSALGSHAERIAWTNIEGAAFAANIRCCIGWRNRIGGLCA